MKPDLKCTGSQDPSLFILGHVITRFSTIFFHPSLCAVFLRIFWIAIVNTFPFFKLQIPLKMTLLKTLNCLQYFRCGKFLNCLPQHHHFCYPPQEVYCHSQPLALSPPANMRLEWLYWQLRIKYITSGVANFWYVYHNIVNSVILLKGSIFLFNSFNFLHLQICDLEWLYWQLQVKYIT